MYGKTPGTYPKVPKLQGSSKALADGMSKQEIPHMQSMLDECNTRPEENMEKNSKEY